MTYTELTEAIKASIYPNGSEKITGQILQDTLLKMTSVWSNRQYAGVAVPATEPGATNGSVFYFAATPGTYTGFGNKIVGRNELAVFTNNDFGSWHKETLFVTNGSFMPMTECPSDTYGDDGVISAQPVVLTNPDNGFYAGNIVIKGIIGGEEYTEMKLGEGVVFIMDSQKVDNSPCNKTGLFVGTGSLAFISYDTAMEIWYIYRIGISSMMKKSTGGTYDLAYHKGSTGTTTVDGIESDTYSGTVRLWNIGEEDEITDMAFAGKGILRISSIGRNADYRGEFTSHTGERYFVSNSKGIWSVFREGTYPYMLEVAENRKDLTKIRLRIIGGAGNTDNMQIYLMRNLGKRKCYTIIDGDQAKIHTTSGWRHPWHGQKNTATDEPMITEFAVADIMADPEEMIVEIDSNIAIGQFDINQDNFTAGSPNKINRYGLDTSGSDMKNPFKKIHGFGFALYQGGIRVSNICKIDVTRSNHADTGTFFVYPA